MKRLALFFLTLLLLSHVAFAQEHIPLKNGVLSGVIGMSDDPFIDIPSGVAVMTIERIPLKIWIGITPVSVNQPMTAWKKCTPVNWYRPPSGEFVWQADGHSVMSTCALENPVSGRYYFGVQDWDRDVMEYKLKVTFSKPPAQAKGGSVIAWRENTSGTANTYQGPEGITAIAAGHQHVVALKHDGTVEIWIPTYITTGSSYGSCVPTGLDNVIAVAAGDWHSVALKSDGTIVDWGFNSSSRRVPANYGGVVAIAAGKYQTLALKNDGTVVGWGIGAPFDDGVFPPAGLSGVVAIAAGDQFSVALKDDGTLVGWGEYLNGHGRLVPAGLQDVVAISARGREGLALKSDGTVAAFVWGDTDSITPVPAGLTDVVAVSSGFGGSVALKRNGTVVTWGNRSASPSGLTGVSAASGQWGGGVALVTAEFDLQQPAGTSLASGSSKDFGEVHTGSAADLTFTIASKSPRALALTGSPEKVAVSGADASLFKVTKQPVSPVPTNGNATFAVRFAPTSVGSKSATLTIANNDSDEGSFVIHVTGTGVNTPPEITLLGANPLKVRPGETYSDPGAKASDEEDGQLTPQIASNTVVPNVPGVYEVTWSVTDSQDVTTTATRVVEVAVRPEDPIPAEVVTKGSPMPKAGTDPRIQTGAMWMSFGDPAISDTGDVAYLAQWKAPATTGATPLPAQNGTGLFINDDLLVKVGESVPGAGANGVPPSAVFKSFKDPVMDQGGHVAFLATIAGSGVSSGNDSVVVSNGRSGTLEIIAREGDVAPATGGAVFKSFTNVSIQGEDIGGTLFVATLGGVKGSAPVTTKNNAGVWWLAAGADSVTKVARKGDPGFATGETIQSIQILQAMSGSTGHGRGQLSGAAALLQFGLVGGATPRQAQVLAEPNTLTEIAGTGDNLGGALLPDGVWAKMNLPSADCQGEDITVQGTLQIGNAGVAKTNAKGIFHSANAGATWDPLARIGGNADEFAEGALFSALGEPVHSSSGAGVAFIATVKAGTGVTVVNNDAIWWKYGAVLQPLVREGGTPPQPASGAQWKSFSSLAYPGNGGPLFVATLKPAPPTGPERITAKNDLGLYAVDAFGEVQELIRENRPLLGKTVKTFSVLKAIAGSAGSARSYNANSQVSALVTFTDGTTGIVKIEIP